MDPCAEWRWDWVGALSDAWILFWCGIMTELVIRLNREDVYLSTLQSIVDNHEYRSKGSYKIDDVSEFLRGISQIEYDPVAADLASRILQESVNS